MKHVGLEEVGINITARNVNFIYAEKNHFGDWKQGRLQKISCPK